MSPSRCLMLRALFDTVVVSGPAYVGEALKEEYTAIMLPLTREARF